MEHRNGRRAFVKNGLAGSIAWALLGSSGLSKVADAAEAGDGQALRDEAIAAHGGLERWRQLSRFSMRISLYGGLFERKGHGGNELANLVCEGTTREPYVRMTGFREPDLSLVYRPDRVSLERTDGTLLRERNNPRDAFAGQTALSKWDDLHLAYFSGYAHWNYFIIPFVFANTGFNFEDYGIWQEDGQSWRRLRVTYPPDFVTHSREQMFYFDNKGLLRRMDYGPTLAGSGRIAHYCDEHKTFDGIVVPTKRRAYRLDEGGNPIKSQVWGGVDISSAEFR
ncbi:hypothetical protein [Cupriavidus necator]|nr:hypothetical protein [Cupriavidus necator]